MKSILTAAALAAFATGASADVYNMSLSSGGTSDRTALPIADGHMGMILKATTDAMEFGMDHPFNGMAGTCSSHMVVAAPSVKGTGLCHYTKDGGDTAVVSITIEGFTADGGLHGAWNVIGGTGALVGVSGGGTYTNSATASDGSFSQQIAGAIALP